MAPAKYYSVTASLTSPRENSLYKHSEEQVNFPGWKVVGGYEETNVLYSYLQTIKKGSILNYCKITSKVTLKELKTHYTEAKLVQLLEKKGIGRPSTFSALIDKIQERDYVKKEHIKGKKIKCVDFELEGDELGEIETERVFGNEKNKLVIKPLGVLVLEFLIDKYDALFNYEYTANMELLLDMIAKGEMVWYELCRQCFQQINTLSSLIERKEETLKIRIDDQHVYMIGKYGPVIKVGDKDNTTFRPVKHDLDLEKLRRGEYSIEEIVDNKQTGGRILGDYKDKSVILKKGKFGLYAEWGDKKTSLSGLQLESNSITLESVIEILNNPPGLIRKINNDLSIRSGKYGDYIFYKTKTMKKPRFLKLKSFDKNYKTCSIDELISWIEITYKIK